MVEVKHVHTLAPEVLELLAGLIGGKTAKVIPAKSAKRKPAEEEEEEEEETEEEETEEEEEEITKDDLRELAGKKKEKGKGPAIIKLLASAPFKVKSITNLADKHVKAFHEKLKAL